MPISWRSAVTAQHATFLVWQTPPSVLGCRCTIGQMAVTTDNTWWEQPGYDELQNIPAGSDCQRMIGQKAVTTDRVWHLGTCQVLSLVMKLFSQIFFFLTTVLSHWDFSHGKFRLLSLRKASCDSCATQPAVHAGYFSVSIIYWTLDVNYRIFHMHTEMLMHAMANGVYT